MTQTLISIDLDWLNGKKKPVDKLKRLLHHIPNNTPAIITIEHHQFLPQLRRWIESGKVPTPFNIINFDEHHDYYKQNPPHDPNGTAINCGNWGYRLSTDWYRRLTWVTTPASENIDWPHARQWLRKRNIVTSVRQQPRLSQLCGNIVAAIFCVSPDYLCPEIMDHIVEIIEIVAHHFNMKRAPKLISGSTMKSVDGWRIAPRPLKWMYR